MLGNRTFGLFPRLGLAFLAGAAIASPVLSAQAPQSTAASYTGTVLETMNSGDYTYLLVDTGSKRIWAATSPFDVEVGDEVVVPAQLPMTNFKSKALGRTFDLIYFAGEIRKLGEASPEGSETVAKDDMETMGKSHTKSPKSSGLKAIEPAGQTIAELFAKREEFSGKPILVRGQVVKVMNGIMGSNWLHIQDGSGEPGSDDLTVTTSATVKKGDVVLVSGKLTLDKDFGMGYFYALIVENATVTAQ